MGLATSFHRLLQANPSSGEPAHARFRAPRRQTPPRSVRIRRNELGDGAQRRARAGSDGGVAPHLVPGTPGFIAPEIKDLAQFDTRADVFGWGMTLYCCSHLIHRPPERRLEQVQAIEFPSQPNDPAIRPNPLPYKSKLLPRKNIFVTQFFARG